MVEKELRRIAELEAQREQEAKAKAAEEAAAATAAGSKPEADKPQDSMAVDEDSWVDALTAHLAKASGVPIPEAAKRAAAMLEEAGAPSKKLRGS